MGVCDADLLDADRRGSPPRNADNCRASNSLRPTAQLSLAFVEAVGSSNLPRVIPTGGDTSYRSVAHRPQQRRRTLVTVRLQRQVVDYALRRRSLLAEVYSGRTGVTEVCDANPYLLRAAKFHGKLSSVMCPICRKEQLTLVSWVFGEHLGAVSGSARSAEELILLTTRFDEFAVHVVEVCRTCSWNHLVKSYVLGTPRPAKGAPGTRTARRTGARTASE